MKTEVSEAPFGHRAIDGVKTWVKETKGSVMVLVALSLPVVVGVAGLGIDLSSWYAERRMTQNIADSAVVAATHAVMAGQDQQGVEAEAMAEAQRNGYKARPGDELVVTLLGGTSMGAATAEVEVLVHRSAPVFFTSLFVDYQPAVAASAMGGVRGNGTNCIIGLDPYAPHTVNFMGNTTVNVGCGVYSHSEAAESLYVGGNATLYANPAQARGDIIVSGSGEIYSANGNLMP
ncbi:MAG: Tad domain-containing protein, partial [Rhodovibrionaceae bacterium]